MTRAALLASALLVACGSAQAPRSGNERHRPELHCTERPPGGEEACRARRCEWTAPLSCYGVQPPDEVEEEERRAYEAGTRTCACVCASDREACANTP